MTSMLARARTIQMGSNWTLQTPLLIPAFSSRVMQDLGHIIQGMSTYIYGPILLSAYDIHYYGKKMRMPVMFPSMIFIDSGGYEASGAYELLDCDYCDQIPREWSPALMQEVWDRWPVQADYPPTVFISYDHPRTRYSVAEQISYALKSFSPHPAVAKELLIKPETWKQQYVQLDSILQHVGQLKKFDIIGVTAKEMGWSILQRMQNIATLREAMDAAGVVAPLHIFGSLDSIETPLYFAAGAELFDGLTWHRYAYSDGKAMYTSHYGALELGIHARDLEIKEDALQRNVSLLEDLSINMQGWAKDQDFSRFGRDVSDCLTRAYDKFCSSRRR